MHIFFKQNSFVQFDVLHENMFSKVTASLIFKVDQHIFQPHDLGREATITLWMKRASILL